MLDCLGKNNPAWPQHSPVAAATRSGAREPGRTSAIPAPGAVLSTYQTSCAAAPASRPRGRLRTSPGSTGAGPRSYIKKATPSCQLTNKLSGRGGCGLVPSAENRAGPRRPLQRLVRQPPASLALWQPLPLPPPVREAVPTTPIPPRSATSPMPLSSSLWQRPAPPGLRAESCAPS